jgi:hypothetical protein
MMDSRDGRLTWALKSRRRYHETLELAPVRAALAARRVVRRSPASAA